MSQLFDTATEERRSEVCTREVCEMIVLSETRLRIDTLNEDQVVFVHHETLKNLITFQKVGRKTQLPVQWEKDFLFHNLPEWSVYFFFLSQQRCALLRPVLRNENKTLTPSCQLGTPSPVPLPSDCASDVEPLYISIGVQSEK